MYPRKKRSPKKIYFAITLLVVLAVATAAVVYYTGGVTPAKQVSVGVHVGDTFTYNLKGTATLTGIDATVPDDFYLYNSTDFYKVTVTDVTGTNVSLDSQWRFLNGTEFTESQIIDLSSGWKKSDGGFWAIYAANLNVRDLLRPSGFDQKIVNKTDTQAYLDSTRERNFFEVANEFSDIRDPTRSTFRYDYMAVYFDKQTGALQSLTNYQSYNNPQMTLVITWTLVDSNVWNVK